MEGRWQKLVAVSENGRVMDGDGGRTYAAQ